MTEVFISNWNSLTSKMSFQEIWKIRLSLSSMVILELLMYSVKSVRMEIAETNASSYQHITVGIVTDQYVIPTIPDSADNNASRSISVVWAIEKFNEKYQILEVANSLQQYGADLIVLVLQNTTHQVQSNNVDVFKPFISAGRLYNYGIPTQLCHTIRDINLLLDPRNKIDYLSNSLYSKSEIIRETVFAMATKSGWTTIVLFYELSTEIYVEELLHLLSGAGISVLKYNFNLLKSEKDIDAVLQKLYSNLHINGLNVTLICTLKCINTILHRANVFDSAREHKRKTAMHQQSTWLILSVFQQDVDRISWKSLQLDNVALINLECQSLSESLNFKIRRRLVDLRMEMDMLLCDVIPDENVTSPMILQNRLKTIIQELDKMMQSYHKDLYMKVKSLLWYKHGRSFSWVGRMYIHRKLTLHTDIYPNRHHGFNGRQFVVTTHWWPPFVKKETHNGSVVYSGFCMDLLEELATTLNFTYVITEPADQEWGRQRPNGSWTGMIGQLENEEVDLMIAPNSIQAPREEVMDFTYPFYYDTTTFLVKRIDPNRNKWRTFIDPLSWQVLVCVAISLPTAAFFLFLVEKYSHYHVIYNQERHDFQYAFWYMLGALLTQGGAIPPSSQSGRTLISFWWIFSIILVATYSGNLIAFLTVTKEKLPFKTFDEVGDQTEYTWGICGGTYIITLVQTSPLPTFRKLWQGIERNLPQHPQILDINPDVHVNKVLNEDYIFFCDKTYFEILSSENCSFVIGEEEYPNMNYGVGLPNNSAYTSLFSKKVLELLESGIVQIWKEKHWPKQSFCKGSLTTEAKKITIIDVQSAFFLIAIGITCAFIALLIEYIVSRINKCKECFSKSNTAVKTSVCEVHTFRLKSGSI